MKVILNEILKDIQGNEIKRDFIDAEGNLINKPIKFCDILYDGLLAYRPYEDEKVLLSYELAKKMLELSTVEVQEIEITNEEYSLCQDIMKGETMVVRAKFLEMLNTLNPTPETPEEPLLYDEEPVKNIIVE